MRSFTQDRRILTALDIIEQQLGYSIHTLPLSVSEFRRMSCGVQPRDGKWTFRYYPMEAYTSEVLCHELMHITLAIEGWPRFLIIDDPQKYEDTAYMEGMTTVLFQHIKVWNKGILLGFSEATFWNKDIDQNMIPKIIHRLLLRGARPGLRESCQALSLAQALLSPANRASKKRLKQAAGMHLPQALERANAILRVCAEYEKVFPQSLEIALKKVYDILGMPEDTHQLEFPSTAYPDFFVQIQQQLSLV